MPNLIQIKRSLTAAAPGSLANGELAFTANGDVLYVGSNSVVVPISGKRTPGVLTANQALVANSTGGIDEIRTANAVITKIHANGAFGADTQALLANSTGGIYWGTPPGGGSGSVTNIATGSGLTGGPITTTGTISVLANSGLIANSTGVFVNANTGVVANSLGVFIGQAVGATNNVTFNDITATGNVIIGDTNADRLNIRALSSNNFIPAANTTYSLGNSTLAWSTVFSNNVQSNFMTITNDLTVTGNLYVNGDTVTINVSSLNVEDSIIKLASNNTASDTIDAGLFGVYNNGVTRFAGLFRDASDTGTFKLFANLSVEPTTTVATGDASFALATLESYLKSGAFVSNTTAVTITANSTISVNVTANTLTLGTALVGTSGGTGRSTVTNNALLVANSTNGYNQLTLGADGLVLQSNGTALLYATLDGGAF